MNLDLTGKTALIGGSSGGLGLASAIELSRLGASCILTSRNEDSLKKALSKLEGEGHSYFVADYDKPETILDQVQQYLSEGNRVELLVNNTGGPPSGNILDLNADDFETGFRQHFRTSHELSRMLIPGMKAAGYGRIVNILSVSVKETIPSLPVSNMIRAGLANWAKTLAGEVASDGITVNNVLPGYTATDRLTYLFDRRAEASGKTVEEVTEGIISNIPAGRMGRPEELGQVVAFLCSPAASYVNGVNLPVDGGALKGL